MNEVLNGLDFAFVCLDDILIGSRDTQEPLMHLDMVCGRLAKCGIRINVAKCVLGVKELPFLGYLVSGEGI